MTKNIEVVYMTTSFYAFSRTLIVGTPSKPQRNYNRNKTKNQFMQRKLT